MFDVIPINHQTWIICGGRDFADQEMFDSAMGDLIRLRGMPCVIVEGDAPGADRMAGRWAERHAIDLRVEPADWKTHGRAAGPIRNAKMLEHNPQLVVAFPGGRGTAGMVRLSRDAGVDVAEIVPTVPTVAGDLFGVGEVGRQGKVE